MARIKELRQQKADLVKEADELVAKLDADEIDDDGLVRLAEITDEGGELDKVNAKIATEERLMEERRSMELLPANDDLNDDTAREATQRVEIVKETTPFGSFGEQLQAIAYAGQAGVGPSEWDRRLVDLFSPGSRDFQGAISGASQTVPSDGGFLVQQDFAADIFESMFDGGQLLSRVMRVPISANANGLKAPMLDETSRANGSRWGGVRGYWVNEADSATATKPTFRELDMRLKKLMGLFYATDELLADAMALESIASQAFTEEMTFKTEDAIVNGTGSGQPLGILNSGALISITAESGQAAATFRIENVLNMWSRMPARMRMRAVWLINQDVEPQLYNMTLGTGTAVTLVYAPPGQGGNQNQPFGTLLGRPVLPVEYCATLGTVGDVILLDPQSYIMIDKGGIQSNASMHVRFLFDEMTFRFTYRVDGEPSWRSAVTAFKGSNTYSPYIATATRS